MCARRRAFLVVALLVTAVVTGSSSAWGVDLGNPKEFVKAMNGQGMMDKLGRGATNTLTGWCEIPYAIDVELNAGSNAIAASAAGLFKGLVLGVQRTAVGVFELVTFWAPVPEDYRPIIPDPAYLNPAH